MLNKEHLQEAMYQYGRSQALALREEAPDLTDTQVLAAEMFIPEWKMGPQAAGALVRRSELEQVYRVLQAHDSTGNPDWRPELTPALFSVCHSSDPDSARPWVAPLGASGMYYQGECYRDEQGRVWRQVYEGGNAYNAAALPERWEQVE